MERVMTSFYSQHLRIYNIQTSRMNETENKVNIVSRWSIMAKCKNLAKHGYEQRFCLWRGIQILYLANHFCCQKGKAYDFVFT